TYGRAPAMACWALTIRDAAMSSMARVIFFVDSTLRMRRRRTRSCPPAMPAYPSSLLAGGFGRSGQLLELADGGVEPIGVRQDLVGTNFLQELPVTGLHGGEELRLEALDVLYRDVVDEAVGCRVDGEHLLLDRYRRVLGLLEHFREPVAAVQ